jgi:hypothetical protein
MLLKFLNLYSLPIKPTTFYFIISVMGVIGPSLHLLDCTKGAYIAPVNASGKIGFPKHSQHTKPSDK